MDRHTTLPYQMFLTLARWIDGTPTSAVTRITIILIWLKVKVMAKVKIDGHIWGLVFNRYVSFWFQGNWALF